MSKIYLNSPFFVQNAILSAYGFYIYRQRFGGEVPEEFRSQPSPFQFDREQVRGYQQKKLSELAHYCWQYVPYYRELFAQLGISPGDITLDNYAELIPVLSKKNLLEHQEKFYSSEPGKDFLLLNTSGTSGSPLKIKATKEARRINYYFYNQVLNFYGSDYRAKSTTFAGRVLFKSNSKRFDRYDYFNRTQYLSSYYISENNCESYLRALNEWRPEFIDSYPSAIFELQRQARLKNIKLDFKPKFILTSSETLTKASRDAIEDYFNCSVVDHYGCTEMAISAYSNGDKYFINPLQSLVEWKPNNDNTFSLIATGLINNAMPLLRYEIGDNVLADDPAQPYVFNAVVGRVDDVVVTPEGQRIGRLDPVFKGVLGIELAQIEQIALDRLVVRVVLSDLNGALFNERLLVSNIQERTSQTMQVEIHRVDAIASGKNGKFRSVINSYLAATKLALQ